MSDETYKCSCTGCGWQGRRTLTALAQHLACPKCDEFRVYPDNSCVNGLLPEPGAVGVE